MNASEVLALLRRHHRAGAIVTELTITDDWAWSRFDEQGTEATALPVYTRRVDALLFEHRMRTAIEVKVSVADARRESPNKVHPWRRVVHRYVYAVPAGLIDTPPVYGCGLWWVHDNGRIEVRRKTRVNPAPEPLPLSVVQALAFRAARQPGPTPEERML